MKREQLYSSWPNRVGKLLALVAFVLIWFGGLVTTTDAGMAVPDWPKTYGYNMFLYPIYDWFFGPWDLFVEHGHRLLGSIAGLLSIALVVVSFCCDRRRGIGWAAVGLLILVIFQGILGGQRVVLDDRSIANVHGCVGPLFFLLVVAFCVVTSRWYHRNVVLAITKSPNGPLSKSVPSGLPFAMTMLMLSYLQLVAGTFLRHLDIGASPKSFQHMIFTHLGLASLLFIGTIFYWIWSWNGKFSGTGLRSSINFLAGLICMQILLGLTTWVLKYGFPGWMDGWHFAAGFIIPEKSFGQTILVTAHMAFGSLILAFWTIQVTRFHGISSLRKAKRSDILAHAARAFNG